MPIQSFDFSTGKVVDTSIRQVVLYVQDMADVEVLQPIFRSKRYQILGQAKDERAALELMRKYKTGILFLDEDIAGLDVKQFAETMQSKHPDFRMVMMSAEVTKEKIQAALAMGAAGYLLKPLSENAVNKTLDNIGAN